MRPLWLRDFSKRLRTQEDKVAGPLQLLSSYLRHWSAFPMTTGTSEKTVILKSRGKIEKKKNGSFEDFPNGPVVKAPHAQSRAPRFNP